MHRAIEIWLYENAIGKSPFHEWLIGLKDKKARHVIRARLDRLAYGLAGKCEPVGAGVFELKIYFGPGYRIYFGQAGQTVVVLLCGGDKSTQSKDIETAKSFWSDFKRRQLS